MPGFALLMILATSPEAARLAEEAAAFAQAGDLAKASERLERAVTLDPNEPIFLYNVAQLREAMGNREGAVEAYEKYLVASPSAEDAQEVRQRVARLRAQVAASDPALREAFLRAQAYVRMGRHDEAERELSAILQKQPDWPPALKSRSLLREQRQQFEPALEDLRRFSRVAEPAEQAQVDQHLAELSIKAADQRQAREAEARQREAESEARRSAAEAAARQAAWARQQAAATAAAAAEQARVRAIRAQIEQAQGKRSLLIVLGSLAGGFGIASTAGSMANSVRGNELNEALRAGELTDEEMKATIRKGRDANGAAIGLGVLGGVLLAGGATLLTVGVKTEVPTGLSATLMVAPIVGGAAVGMRGSY